MNAPDTVFLYDREETDKTGETDLVGNVEFLTCVFGAHLAGARPMVVSFVGNPASVSKSALYGQPWSVAVDITTALPGDANNYFSLVAFRPHEAGQYRRQKVLFVTLHAVMLDDVGSKVAMDRLTLPPNWLLQTSPGNFQAGYLLGQQLADGLLVDRLMNAIITTGLCDPGAGGPCVDAWVLARHGSCQIRPIREGSAK